MKVRLFLIIFTVAVANVVASAQNKLDEAAKSSIQARTAQKLNIAPLSSAAKLARVKALSSKQPAEVSKLISNASSFGSPIKLALSKNVAFNGSKFIGGLTFLNEIVEANGIQDYVALSPNPGGSAQHSMLFVETVPDTPGVYIFDFSIESGYGVTTKLHIDGPGVIDSQMLDSDGHVLFLANVKSVSALGLYYYVTCDKPWKFKSVEITQFK